MQSDEVEEHGTASLPENIPSRRGYDFVGWTTDEDALNDVTADMSISAEYSPCQYAVTFDAMGRNEVSDVLTVIYDQPYGALPSAEHDDIQYVLSGWMDELSVVVTPSTVVRIDHDHTLTAVWHSVLDGIEDGDDRWHADDSDNDLSSYVDIDFDDLESLFEFFDGDDES